VSLCNGFGRFWAALPFVVVIFLVRRRCALAPKKPQTQPKMYKQAIIGADLVFLLFTLCLAGVFIGGAAGADS